MATWNGILPAREITPGMWILPEGSEWPSEIYKVTRSCPVINPETGRREYLKRRFYFDARTDAKHGAEHFADSLVAAF